MSDLRERIGRTLNLHQHYIATRGEYACICGNWSVPVPYNAVDAKARHERHRTDAVVADVAAWLRERAETEHDPNCSVGRRELGGQGCAHFDARWRRNFAIALADEIDPREARDEQ